MQKSIFVYRFLLALSSSQGNTSQDKGVFMMIEDNVHVYISRETLESSNIKQESCEATYCEYTLSSIFICD